MSGKTPQYDEDFKRTLVELHPNCKSQTERSKEYGVSLSALGKFKSPLCFDCLIQSFQQD